MAAALVDVQIFLKVQQLSHEGEVGGDVGLAVLDVVVGLVEAHVLPRHEVGHGHGHRAADACQAVDQDSLLVVTCFV